MQTCHPLLLLPPDTAAIEDADEEIFDLYTALNDDKGGAATSDAHQGLGFIDSKPATLDLSFTLRPPPISVSPLSPSSPALSPTSDGSKHSRKSPRTRRKSLSSKSKKDEEVTVEIKVAQDPHALRHRPGDTGSVAWRASLLFAELLWSYRLFPSRSEDDAPFLDVERFRRAKVLELGSGTGALAMACRSWLDPTSASWTVSDQFDSLKLIRRTFALNDVDPDSASTPFEIQEVDWVEVASRKRRSLEDGQYDIVLAVDCLFNESLVLPFLKTISYFSGPASPSSPPTLAIVVSELRSAEVFRLFLDEWIRLDEGAWKVVRAPRGSLGGSRGLGMDGRRYAVWCGWKTR